MANKVTKREIIKRYLDSIDRVRTSGDTTEPLLPFFLGDALYSIYAKDIAPLKLTKEQKKIRRDWADNYSKFNKPFFMAIGEGDEIVTDMMDDFENAIGNELMVLRSQLMLLLGDVPFDERKPIVSALLCHVLAQAAQCAWGNVYRVGHIFGKGKLPVQNQVVHKAEKNMHLDAIGRDAMLLVGYWYDGFSIDPNKAPGVPPAVTALCRKIYRWLADN